MIPLFRRRAGDHRRQPDVPGPGQAKLISLGRGFAWLDTGTPESLLQAGQYVQTLDHRQGVRIACIEEVALRMGFIDAKACHELGSRLAKSGHGQYVMAITDELAVSR